MHKLLARMIDWLCRFLFRYPLLGILFTVLITIPAVNEVRKIKLRTNLLRLLPKTTRAAVNTQKLDNYVSSDGGHFSLIISQTRTNTAPQTEKLQQAVEAAAARIRKLPNVSMVLYTWPSEFIKQYRLLLVPERSLKLILEKIIGWKAEASPAGVNLLDEGGGEKKTMGEKEDWSEMESNFKQYANYYKYHQSNDGYQYGIKVYTLEGVSSFEKLVGLYQLLEQEATRIGKDYGFECGVGGSHRNKIAEYQVILQDIGTAGLISMIMILLLILVSFRSITAVILVLVPLLVGLVWGFSFVPVLVESLNIITAFLMMILFGMGIDYSIHLVKRFRSEAVHQELLPALQTTFRETGISVIVSALTTALALCLLAFSDFKGFSEFGLITAISIITVLAAMFVLLPALLVLAFRFKLLRPLDTHMKKSFLPGKKTVVAFTVLILAGLVAIGIALKFDFSFRNLQFDHTQVAGFASVRQQQGKIYSGSGSPGALFVTDDLQALDGMIDTLESNKKALGDRTAVGRLTSIRDYSPVPGSPTWKNQLDLIGQIKAEFKEGSWWTKIKQEERRRWVDEIRVWDPPTREPIPLSSIPDSIVKAHVSRDGSGKYLLGLHPRHDRKDGKNAMAFTREVYNIKLPPGVHGPIGETPIFAEILWIVTSEVFLLALGTLLGIFILVWIDLRSIKDSLIVMVPLLGGLVVTFAILALSGIELNLFSVIIIPALLGMGVDNGVHFMNYWKTLKGDTARSQRELMMPLSAASWTTMVGYSGMIFAGHPGIRSIGVLACIGMFLIWAMSLFYLPPLLDLLKRRGLLRLPD